VLQASERSSRELAILGNAIEDLFSSAGFLDFGFREHGPLEPEASTSGRDSEMPPVDVEAIKLVYDKILKLYQPEVSQDGAQIDVGETESEKVDAIFCFARWPISL
jgi:hypothetical protein